MVRLWLFGIALASIGLSSHIASAGMMTIDFTPSSPTLVSTDGTWIDSDGFRFMLDSRSRNSFLQVGSASGAYVPYGNILFNANDAHFEMTAIDGSAFDLLSFEFARRYCDTSDMRSAEVINVIGNLAGGGTVTYTSAAPLDTFTLATLPSNFTNLTRVVFDPVQNVNGGQYNYEFLIDNIKAAVPSAASVPEPASLVLCGLGGVGLVAIRRRWQSA